MLLADRKIFPPFFFLKFNSIVQVTTVVCTVGKNIYICRLTIRKLNLISGMQQIMHIKKKSHISEQLVKTPIKIFTRLRLGHFKLTHEHLLKRNSTPRCITYLLISTKKNILTFSLDESIRNFDYGHLKKHTPLDLKNQCIFIYFPSQYKNSCIYIICMYVCSTTKL